MNWRRLLVRLGAIIVFSVFGTLAGGTVTAVYLRQIGVEL